MLTLETAKKLKEVGFNKPCITNYHIHKDGSSVLKYSANLHDSNYIDVIPCPSLEELLEVMPSYITHDRLEYGFKLDKTFNGYIAEYGFIHIFLDKDPTEAVAQLYIKLRQEGLIK